MCQCCFFEVVRPFVLERRYDIAVEGLRLLCLSVLPFVLIP